MWNMVYSIFEEITPWTHRTVWPWGAPEARAEVC
jgi:hypothetical protein